MFGYIFAHVRRRPARSLALILGVLVATTGFVVLTASTTTSRLAMVGTVAEGSRAPYQILVRPPGARTDLERDRGLIQPNFQAGTHGGITPAQWQQIQDVPGVDVAAPVAMLGYTLASVTVDVDLTDRIDPRLTRQVLRVRPVWSADRALTSAPDDVEAFVYVTRRPVLWPPAPTPDDTELPPAFPGAAACGSGTPAPHEVAEDGTRVPLCVGYQALRQTSTNRRVFDMVVQVLPDGRYTSWNSTPSDRITLTVLAPMALLVAAVDPQAESAMVGLDRAVIAGRYLSASDRLTRTQVQGFPVTTAPALLTAHANVDESIAATVDRVTSVAEDSAPKDLSTKALRQQSVARLPDVPAVPIEHAYQRIIRDDAGGYRDGAPVGGQITEVVRIGTPRYTVAADGTLIPRPQPPAENGRPPDEQSGAWAVPSPWLGHDTGFRSSTWLTLHNDDLQPWVFAAQVGVFDQAKVASADPRTSVPLETYTPTQAIGADPATRDLLGQRPLLPSDNLGGYLATAPSVLISLNTLRELIAQTPRPVDDAISVIRVRVVGVSGYDDLSRERVRLVAQDIAVRTGLDVDIVLGSSPAPQTVSLTAGTFGRPALTVAEPWSKLNVATTLVTAIDRKSALLFGLILIVCGLFLANAVTAAVHDRQRELAILTCLGWARWRVFTAILGELVLLGLVAGVLAATLAWPAGHAAGTPVPIGQAALAVPAAIGLTILAGLLPAVRGSRRHPVAALSRTVSRPHRRAGRRSRSIAALALTNVWRTPGRALVGSVALAVSVCALALLLVLQRTFHGAATGTVLGDAVALSVRGVDQTAVVITVALGVLAVVDVLYLNLRDRASELATLQAIGWSGGALGRLVAYEGVVLALVGALLGAAAAAGLALGFSGGAQMASVILTTGAAAAAGVVVTVLAATVTALWLRQAVPTAALLAEE
ncbi:FtsX-like permease family protein [Asanoa hainanensis]|uniref:FtsX-like permease family protein n=1 Tax=Asanoa hainanensis TaxID=560556 RepID=A0A239PEP2_9ACTN|nr:FtsX-like permease family protein [Asanoa hainanensis]SNT65482.1 FtsX-like permease family protein [Asanoa hainanensis]